MVILLRFVGALFALVALIPPIYTLTSAVV